MFEDAGSPKPRPQNLLLSCGIVSVWWDRLFRSDLNVHFSCHEWGWLSLLCIRAIWVSYFACALCCPSPRLGSATLQTESPLAWLSMAQIHHSLLIHFTFHSTSFSYFLLSWIVWPWIFLCMLLGESMCVSIGYPCLSANAGTRACASTDPKGPAWQFPKLVVRIYTPASIVWEVRLSCKLFFNKILKSGLSGYNLHRVKFTHFRYIVLSFHKHIQFCSHHHSQDKEWFYHSKMFPRVPLNPSF